jgi:NO-binding membrane sensor protein with MHYT domain
MRVRAAVELVVAVLAAVGCVACWIAARSSQLAPPVAANEPLRTIDAYDPSLITLSLVLATVAGILAVVGVARARRR